MTIRASLILLVLLVSVPIVYAQTETPTPTPTPADTILYVPDGDPAQSLLVTLPEGATTPYPTVLLFHGTGASTSEMMPQRDYLAALGYAAVSVDFRTQEGIPAVLSDAFCALGWVHASADAYSFDLSRIAAFGYSNSGWQVALLGAVENGSEFLLDDCPHTLPEDSRVGGVITYSGLLFTPATIAASRSDFSQEQVEYLEYLTLVPPPGWADFLDEAWTDFLRPYPVYWLDASDAPLLIIHGEADELVPVDFSASFAATATSAGVEVDLSLLPEGEHDLLLFDEDQLPEIDAAVTAFLGEALLTGEAASPRETSTPTP